jgi:RecA-family ATPase
MQVFEAHQFIKMPWPNDWLIDGMIRTGDKVFLVGQDTVGKSLLAQQLAACVAGGHPWLGFEVQKPRRVLYIVGEGIESEWKDKMAPLQEVFPYPEGNLWLGYMPEYPIDSPMGEKVFLDSIQQVQPDLTIIDPLYSLIGGSAGDDDRARRFIRIMNNYQASTGDAVIIIHHEHRAKRDFRGKVIDEGSDAYFGSYVWRNWARTPLTMKIARGGQHRVLGCPRTNRGILLEQPPYNGELPLIYISDPMHYTIKEGHTVSSYLVLEALAQPMTVKQVEETCNVSHAAAYRALDKLIEDKLVVKEKPLGVYVYRKV